MTISREDIIAIMNDLIEISMDGQEGYLRATNGVADPDIKKLFFEYSQQRAQFAGELQGEVHKLGGAPARSGTLRGVIHRGWMNIRSLITGHDEVAILVECERGEEAAMRNYKEALDRELPTGIRQLLRNQYAEICQAHEHIRNLRDNPLHTTLA